MKTSLASKLRMLIAIGLSAIAIASVYPNIHYGKLTLVTQSDIDNASVITEVTGDVVIATQGGTTDPIVNLDGLSKLESIGGNLTIKFNPQLSDTLGLLNLTDAGYVFINSNNSLIELDGLSSLAVVDGIYIMDNPSLERFCRLHLLFDIRATDPNVNFDYFILDGGNAYYPGGPDIFALIGDPCPIEEPISPEEWVQGLLEEGILNKGQANSLLKQLQQTKRKALENHVKALIKAGILNDELADPILAVTET